MKEIFYVSPHNTHRKHDIFVQSRKTSPGYDKSLQAIGPLLWNSLPEKLNRQPQYLYSKILSKLGLDLNANINCALFNPLCT